MGRKLILSLVLLGLCVAAPVSAKSIVWVAMNWNADGTGTVNDDWQPFIDGLTAAGYTVDVRPGNWDALTAAKVADLETFDLVLFSRAIQSGTFATNAAEIALWNSVKKPMLTASCYILRKGRWNWVLDDTTVPNNAGDHGSPLMQVLKPSHPIFYGVTLDANNQLKVADPCLCSGQCSFVPTNDVGNGTLIAKTVPTLVPATTSGGSAFQVQDWAWISEWQKGVEFYQGSNNVAAEHRLYFSAGSHETAVVGVNGGAVNKASGYNLTPDGWKLFLNAVKYMIGDAVNPQLAASPSPADGATNALATTVLSWTPGQSMQAHDVYFGTSLADVTNAGRANPLGVLVAQDLATTTFDPAGTLAYGTTYYWRVDEVGGSDKGTVWSFTTEPYSIAMTNITATASSQKSASEGPENTVNSSGMTGDVADVNTKAMWMSLSTKSGGTMPASIQYDFDKPYKLHEMWVWNYNASSELDLGYGAKSTKIEYLAADGQWTTLGDFEFAQGIAGDDYAHNTTVPFHGVVAKSVRLTVNETWGSVTQTGLSEVRFFYIPVWAKEPAPATDSTNVDPTTLTLSWRPGRDAVSHDVYLNTDANALTKASAVPTASYTPAVSLSTKYYWRVDEVNQTTNPTTWAGDVWNFTTLEFLTVDNMEIYNATDKAIFDTWSDGYGTTTNGGQVGYGQPANNTFCETAVIHGGKQSMPFLYGRDGITTSEVSRSFATAQDWTKYGITTLTVFFYGNPANTVGQLYLKINGTNVATCSNSSAVTVPWWTPWNIPLSSVAGVNLKAVTSLAIGITGSAVGTLLIDDIALYRVAPAGATEQVFIEAESSPTITEPFAVTTDTLASSGKYITTPSTATASSNNPSTTGGVATYSFTVKGGVYKIWFRTGVLTSGSNDSFWVRVKNATINPSGNSANPGWIKANNLYTQTGAATWHWVVIWDDDHADAPVQFTIPAGTHTLEISYREVAVPLDAVLITNNLN